MKKRMIALCAATAFLLMAGQAFAEPSINAVQVADKRSVTVEIKAEPFERIAAKVQQKNNTLLGFVGEQEANEAGKAIFEFSMPAAAPDGEYILSYCEGENDAKRYTFDFADITDFLANLNAADSKEDLLELLKATSGNTYAAKVMGIDTEQYYALSETEQLQVLEQYLNLRSGKTPEENSDAFSKAMGVQISDRDKEKALTLYNPEFEGVKFNDLTDSAQKQWLIDALTVSEKTAEGFEKAYGQAQAVYKLLYAKSVEVGAIIDKYGTLLELTRSLQYANYTNLSEYNKGKAHDYIVENITGAKTAQNVLSVFERAVSSRVTQGGGNGSNGGGGGGSRGGYSGSGSGGDIVLGSDFTSDDGNESAFYDMGGYDWAEKAVHSLAEKNIISGYGDGNFRPGQAVTREEFVKMAVCAAGLYDENAVCDFEDVDSDQWYYRYVASGVKSGAINGVGENVFGLGELITRQDMAVIVCRLAEKKGIDLKKKRDYANYADDKEIAEYAKTSIGRLYCAGFINGVETNRFAPLENTTRAQAAKILYDVFYNYGG